jgi:hypothetical protein
MRAAMLVLVLGVAIGALGLIESEMYMVGAVIVFIAMIGILARVGEKLPWVEQ